MKYPHARVLVMSKAPVPGTVKTRLIPLLGADSAADCYRALLENTLENLRAASLCPVELCCAPDIHHDFFSYCRDHYSLELAGQVSGDLGRRMAHAVARTLRQAGQVVVIGGDCPALTTTDIDAALHALARGTDVVLGPAADGGYYLVGLHAPHPRVFESIPWGSSRVLQATMERVAELGLSSRMLATRNDIDTAADYRAWQANTAAGARTQGL